jgi:hypothetical protein
MLRTKALLVPFVVSGLALGLTGCATSAGPAAETLAMGDLMREHGLSADIVGQPTTVAEAMPDTSPSPGTLDDLKSDKPVDTTLSASLVVTGTVTGVSPESAWAFNAAGGIDEVEFGSADADWQYVRVTIAIDSVVDSVLPDTPSESVDVLMLTPVGDSLGFATKAYEGLGQAMFFLVPDSTSASAPYRPLGSLGDWIFTLNAAGEPDGAPLAAEAQSDKAILEEVRVVLVDGGGS